MKQKTGDSLIIFFGALMLFTILLPPEFIAFQTRFALFARNMLHQGMSFFPMTYEHPYPDYPALPIIFVVLISKLFHQVTPLTLMFPTAFFSAAVLVMVYLVGALQNRNWGVYGVLLTLLTVGFITEARSIALDQYVSFVSVLCFYLIYSADLSVRYRRLVWIPLLWIFGFACRGPIGLVVPVGIVSMYYLTQKRFRAGGASLAGGAVFLTICMAGLMGAAYFQGGAGFVKTVLLSQSLGRVIGNIGDIHKQPFYFYWLRGFGDYALAYPIAVFAIFFKGKFSKQSDAFLFKNLFIAFLVIMIGLSIPEGKKVRYILPIVPFVSLLAAYLWTENCSLLERWRKILLIPFKLLPYLVLIAVIAAWTMSRKYPLPQLGCYYWAAIIALLIIIFLKFVIRKRSSVSTTLLFCVLALLSVNFFIIEPVNYKHEETRPFAAQVEYYYRRQKQPIVFYRIGPDQADIKLMANLETSIDLPRFIQSEPQLAKLSNVYLIVEQKIFKKLPPAVKQRMTILYQGRIGHSPCLLVMHTPDKGEEEGI